MLFLKYLNLPNGMANFEFGLVCVQVEIDEGPVAEGDDAYANGIFRNVKQVNDSFYEAKLLWEVLLQYTAGGVEQEYDVCRVIATY